MDLTFLWRGLILGFSIAAPVGPIGVLCIQRTLTRGHLVGLISGLGAATADAIYGMVAAFGLTLISSFLVEQAGWLGWLGVAFLIYLGVKIFRTPPPTESITDAADPQHYGRAYLSTLFLTLTNPLTIVSFTVMFAGLGLVQGDTGQAISLVVGVFVGSALWWAILSSGVSWFRAKREHLVWVNRGAGVVVVVFGVVMLLSLL